MSFWSDASPLTKGVLVVGPILIVIAGLLFTGVIGGGDVEAVQTRGLGAPAAP
jgi:hypothetical protein